MLAISQLLPKDNSKSRNYPWWHGNAHSPIHQLAVVSPSKLLGEMASIKEQILEQQLVPKRLKGLELHRRALGRVIKMHGLATKCGPVEHVRFRSNKSIFPLR